MNFATRYSTEFWKSSRVQVTIFGAWLYILQYFFFHLFQDFYTRRQIFWEPLKCGSPGPWPSWPSLKSGPALHTDIKTLILDTLIIQKPQFPLTKFWQLKHSPASLLSKSAKQWVYGMWVNLFVVCFLKQSVEHFCTACLAASHRWQQIISFSWWQ